MALTFANSAGHAQQRYAGVVDQVLAAWKSADVVCDVNLRLPRDQRVRVIGGDSKVDWAAMKGPEDLLPLMNRGGNIREIIATQLLEPAPEGARDLRRGSLQQDGHGVSGRARAALRQGTLPGHLAFRASVRRCERADVVRPR